MKNYDPPASSRSLSLSALRHASAPLEAACRAQQCVRYTPHVARARRRSSGAVASEHGGAINVKLASRASGMSGRASPSSRYVAAETCGHSA